VRLQEPWVIVYTFSCCTPANISRCLQGKTDAAMLTILHTISLNCIPSPGVTSGETPIYCNKDQFKIVYVAPMKALAAEIVEKLAKRLRWLGIEVRELTGEQLNPLLTTAS